ncbi:MAG: hypothetical protein KA055_03385 [Aliarcobacter sp.]|nr:hypothetical protein [Aliarcobacter sp.]
MKKIVLLLFICLNLFAQKVYDLRDETTYMAMGWFINGEIRSWDLEKIFKKEYSEMEESTNAIDKEDKLNELLTKAKALAVNPKIGDVIISGGKETDTEYKDGKFIFYGDFKNIGMDIIKNVVSSYYFFPESRDYAKKLADYESQEKIRYEVSGIMKGFQPLGILLKDVKISFFDKENNKIPLKEFSIDPQLVLGEYYTAAEYK